MTQQYRESQQYFDKHQITCHCYKCERKWGSEEEYQDQGRCPVCGRHGLIILENPKEVYDKQTGRYKFVPIN